MILRRCIWHSPRPGRQSLRHKDRGGKVVSGPVWDYNLSLGNADYNGGDNPEGWYHEIVGGSNYPWYQRLFQDPEFTLAYWDRWHELRRDEFANEKLFTLIDATTTLMEESQARNFDQWQVLGTKLWPNPSGWDTRDTHRKEVDWMKGLPCAMVTPLISIDWSLEL